jgi:hypothetical protein
MSKTLILRPNRLVLLPVLVATAVVAALIPILTVSILSMTALGAWVLVTLYQYRELKREKYLVSDHSIQVLTSKDDATISLVNITDIISRKYWWLPFADLGEIEIHANGKKQYLKGIQDALGTAGIIKLAVDAAIARARQQRRPPTYQPPTHPAGTLEQMNDLVGLWQQGILTDEEYQIEVKRMTAD